MKYKNKAQKEQVQGLKGYLEAGIPELEEEYNKLNIETNVFISGQKAPLPPSIFVFQEFAGKVARMKLCSSTYKILMYFFSESQFQNFVNIDQKTIQEELKLSRKSVSSAIAELKELNIIVTFPHPNDKRRNEYFLNPTGAWKGKSYDRIKAIKKIRKETKNELQIGIPFEKSEKTKRLS
jgi:DNA-binding MarR family transcriptional regulator